MGPKKNQKMSLGTFLQDENYGSWADEMEDMPLPSSDSRPTYGSERRTFGPSSSGAGFSDRRDGYPPREQLPLPTQPPYTAHLANLSFDATQGDVNEFFKDCSVTNVRIVEDKLDRKPKGFGYVEFATLDGLKAALALSGSNLAGRQVRVSVAEPPKDRQDTRDFSDWSRKGPLPDVPQTQRRVSDRPPFAGRNLDPASDASNERNNRRGAYEQGDGKSRDFSNWERKGPLSPAAPAPLSLREGGRQQSKDGPGGFRKNSPAWGEGRSQDGSRPPRRDVVDKPAPERQPTASELDNQWRARMRPDAPAKAPTPEASEPSSPAPSAPAMRPKLNLQKRTVSEAVEQVQSPPADSKFSPFGAARPVDTATKEKEVEEKRQLALRQKKEADDKARAEKSEEKRLAREKAEAEKVKEPSSKEETAAKDDGETKDEETAQPTPKFDVLRRAGTESNDMVADDDVDDETETPQPTDDKAVKPREVVRNTPSRANGSWRGPKPTQGNESTTAAALEEDGWSTVSKPTKQRNNRRNAAPRAIAS
ncbi:hypothetical protein PV10_04778 [Exophiala mesophila]|uniref:RRM domain-containing protein n=2 Tax=Exophiala mesophila TaxID=212818 RepID=A0A0D2A3L6_EXOME|nr:uncharacterized protein PV10_04778 [Exophiala mesophila]KIV93573.1 hypothetical protein PV10_04778 [Exophiala mesophila]